MSGAIGPGDWVVIVREPGVSVRYRMGSVAIVVDLEDGAEFDPCDYCDGPVTVILPGEPDVAWCTCGLRLFQGPEQSSLGLSRKLPTCEPI